jgi:hypothetical protein
MQNVIVMPLDEFLSESLPPALRTERSDAPIARVWLAPVDQSGEVAETGSGDAEGGLERKGPKPD